MPRKLSHDQEKKVLALLARGDTYNEIIDTLKKEDKLDMTIGGLQAVKKRNAATLAVLDKKLMTQHMANASSILTKSRRLLDKKLDRLEESQEYADKKWQDFQSGHISFQEYSEATRSVPSATLAELSTVSKEAFSQAQTEQGRGTSTADVQKEVQELVKAIQSGDEVVLQQLIFRKNQVLEQ